MKWTAQIVILAFALTLFLGFFSFVDFVGAPAYADVLIQVSGSGTTTPAAGYYFDTYIVGGSVTVTAYPASGWKYMKMQRNGVDWTTASPYTFTSLDYFENITVFFSPYVTLVMSVVGSGTTSPAVGTYSSTYVWGETVSVSGTAGGGYVFYGMRKNGAWYSYTSPTSFTLSGATTYIEVDFVVPTAWHPAESWSFNIGSVATGFHPVETWSFNIASVASFHPVETWSFSIAAGASFHDVEAWNFSIFSAEPAMWHDVESWNFTLNSTLTLHPVEAWNFTLDTYGVHDVEYWNFTLNSTATWQNVEYWNFTISTNIVGWRSSETWNFSMFSFHQGFAWPAHFPFWLKAYDTYVDFNDWAYFDTWNWNPDYITYVTFSNISMGVGLPVPSMYVSVLNGNVSFSQIDYLHVVSFDLYGFTGTMPQLILQGLGSQAAYMTVDGTLFPIGAGWLYDSGTDTTTVQFTFNATGYYSVVLSWGIAPSAWHGIEQWNFNLAASAGPSGIIIVTNTTSYYLRSDTITVNNSTAYYMNVANSATALTISIMDVNSGLSGSIGYRVYILHQDGSVSELTAGVPEAVGTLTLDNASYVNSNWNCPRTGLSVGWDAIRVDAYLRAGSDPWTLKGSWATDDLLDNAVLASTWVFNAYLNKTSTAGTTVSFTFGSGTLPGIVSGVLLNPATEFELMLYNLGMGNFFTFLMYPFTYLIGNLVYGLMMLLILVPVYVKYRDIDVILLMMIMFGGAGGFFWAMIPETGLWVGFVVMAFALAALIYRVWPH